MASVNPSLALSSESRLIAPPTLWARQSGSIKQGIKTGLAGTITYAIYAGWHLPEGYWAIFAALREELSYADYLAALQRFRAGLEDHPELLQMSSFILEYPFSERLYPRALDAIAHLGTLGMPAILSDGDVVFQPRKIQRSGLWNAVQGRVLIDVHKERALDAMQRRLPARHYVMIDDKPRLLAAMKCTLGKS
jgi:FMN phosphatase YigB (HAD superfamily)